MKVSNTSTQGRAKTFENTSSINPTASGNHLKKSDRSEESANEASKKSGYRPYEGREQSRKGEGHLVGIILPTVDRSFFASVVRGIEEILNKADYKVMICQSYDIFEKEVMAVDALLNAKVAGIIVSIAKTTTNLTHLERVRKNGTPLILFDRGAEELDVSQVIVDDFMGAYLTVEHFIQQGCTRIAHFTSSMKVSIYKERFRGYKEALARYNLPFNSDYVIESNLQLEDGREGIKKLLDLKEIPDAVFSASDYSAMGAMQVLKELNIKIPQEIALAGFANEPFTSFTDPSLTSVDQLSITMGNVAAEVFFKEIAAENDNFVPQTITLTPELIVRNSSIKR